MDGGTRDRESSVQGSASSSEPQLRLPSGITLNLVSALVQAYYEVVYPLYPIFHRQTLLDRLENSDHTHDRAFHCAVMSLCALTMTRVRDGAYYTNSGRISEEHFIHVPTFLESAASNMTRDPSGAENNDVLKSCLMLALTSLQENDIRNMKYYLGLYHSFVQIEGLTNERNWPQDLGRVETEERRRVFWSMYNLDLFCAACFESNMAWRESHILVNYPLEIYDEDLSDDLSDDAREGRPSEASSTPRGAPPQPRMPSWLVGWNFVTDLYRILEHAIDRRKRLMNPEQARTAQLFFPEAQSASQHSILRDIMTRYDRLPACFKEIRSVTFNMSSDCYVFQAANVAATIQLVRMTLFTTEMATTDQRCQIVSEVLQTFMEAPIGCLKAMSTPFFYHLSVIGTILVSAFRSPQCNASYGRVREVVLTLANLLANLEEHSQMAEPPSYRLRLQISRVDAYVRKEVAASRMAAIGGQTGGNLQFSETDSRRFADDGHHFSFPPVSSFRNVYNTIPFSHLTLHHRSMIFASFLCPQTIADISSEVYYGSSWLLSCETQWIIPRLLTIS